MRNSARFAVLGQLFTVGIVIPFTSNVKAQSESVSESTKPAPDGTTTATTSPITPSAAQNLPSDNPTAPSSLHSNASQETQLTTHGNLTVLETKHPTSITPAPKTESPITKSPDDPQVTFGAGLRVQYTYDPKVKGQDFSQDVGTNVRPYISGSANRYIKFQANLDSNFSGTTGNVQVLDAIIKVEVNEYLNLWAGRLLPPTDRANLSGPYYQNSWNYPVHSNLYPAIYAGRSNGAAYWGQINSGVFKWQVGMFDLTGTDHPLFAGRFVLNLLAPESGYYNSSTYYGEKDILAIGLVGQYQKKGDITKGTGINGAAASVDVLFEKSLRSSGTLSVEGAYYNFKDTQQGSSVWGLLGYLAPGKQGIGTLQVVARLQHMTPEVGESYSAFDAGLHYVMKGHNARAALNYQVVQEHAIFDTNQVVTLGGQLQF